MDGLNNLPYQRVAVLKVRPAGTLVRRNHTTIGCLRGNEKRHVEAELASMVARSSVEWQSRRYGMLPPTENCPHQINLPKIIACGRDVENNFVA